MTHIILNDALAPVKPIWIVDDDPSIRFVLEKALAREDFAVRSFTSTKRMDGSSSTRPTACRHWLTACSTRTARRMSSAT